ncbi:MAG: hypothetical protein JWQ89_2630 [Devosia sp.]|nr:hypothetical protein [Devosia sp.]MDB5540903.1 hypothetical protein [Devosia sp.]
MPELPPFLVGLLGGILGGIIGAMIVIWLFAGWLTAEPPEDGRLPPWKP